MDLSLEQISILLQALNDREGVLSGDYERAFKANGVAKIEWLKGELAKVRAVAEVLSTEERRLLSSAPGPMEALGDLLVHAANRGINTGTELDHIAVQNARAVFAEVQS